MRVTARSFLTAPLLLVGVLLASPGLAHPPWDPFDQTRFAPITRFGPQIGIEVVTDGLTAPLKAVPAPGLPRRLIVVDQPGVLWAVDLTNPDPQTNKTVFLDVRSRVITLGVCGPDTFDERGLLGVAFHPNYAQNGLLYTYTSEVEAGPPTFPSTVPAGEADHQNVIAEWRVASPGNPASVVDPASRRELMRVSWPQFNHDGGDLAFGPDRKLYISMGDGGGADDANGQLFINALPRYPQNPDCSIQVAMVGHQVDGNAQKLNTPLGKILRIDVDGRSSANGQYGIPRDNPFVGRGGLDEIWAYGFRNPYRFGFDSGSGDLYVGDVGENDIEEVDIVRRGRNFGWNCKEGTLFFHINGTLEGFASPNPDPARPQCNPRSVDFRDPVAQYDTHHEGHSVIGGYVYHGRGVRALRGKYVFADFALLFKFPRGPHDYGRLLVMDADDRDRGLRSISEVLVLPGGAISLAMLGIGQDARGELYALGNVNGVPFGTDGRVLRLVAAPEADKGDDRDDE
jgi:glucose/arabinose dehydrogenase